MDLETSASLAVVVLFLFMAAPAYAYIDPGSGSMLVQLLTGCAAGALILLRLYWRRLKDRFRGPSAAAEPASPGDAKRPEPTHPE
jgi:hypothetical protein